jgi:threonine/homoserine/homoserine lactone efflux protein
MSDSFIPAIGILFAAAITPGPNNMIVMQAGARGGVAAASAVIFGVVSGSLILLALVWLGVGAAFRATPNLELAVSIAGGAYLAWLGVSLMLRGSGNQSDAPPPVLPSTMLGVAGFQLLNPKAWLLVTATAAAMPRMSGVATLAILIAVVTTLCLMVWAVAGAASSRVLVQKSARLWFDRAMGGLLAISAVALVVG